MGDKPCAFQDLRPFIKSLPADQVVDFLNSIAKLIGIEDGQSPTNVITNFKFYLLNN